MYRWGSIRVRSREVVRGWTLFKIPSYQASSHPLFDFVFTFSYVLCVIALSTTVIVLQLRDRPDEIRYKHVSSLQELDYVPPGYQCACKLPDYIQGIRSLGQNKSSLQGCYSVQDDVSTIYVVQFSDGTVPELLTNVRNIDQSVAVSNKTVKDGLIISQDAVSYLGFVNVSGSSRPSSISEDFLSKIDPKEAYRLAPAELIPISQINGSIKDWGLAIQVEFDCCNETKCSQIKQVTNFCKKLHNATSCPVSSTSKYHGRCMMTAFTGPDRRQFVVDLLQTLRNNSAIRRVGTISDSGSFIPSISLSPDLQFAAVKNLTTDAFVTYTFMEVEKGSATWLQLQNLYPNLGTQCKDVPGITVCSMPSICSLQFRYTISSSSMWVECLELPANMSKNQCKDLFAWKGNKLNQQELQELCRWQTNDCTRSAYSLKSYSSLQLHVPTGNDSHATLINYIDDYNKKEYKNTVCTNVYQQVVKYDEKYMETNCSAGGLCYLTGKYHQVNSMPFESMQNMAPDSVPQPSFLCYTIQRQKLLSWTINCAGILGGLLGTTHTLAFLLYFGLVETFSWLRNTKRERDLSL